MNFMVIGKSLEKDDLYFGGIYPTEDEAVARLEFIKENFSGFQGGNELWTVQPFGKRKQLINQNTFMVIKFDE